MHIKRKYVFILYLVTMFSKNMYNKQRDFTSIIGHFFSIFINIYDPLAITTENDSKMIMVVNNI